MARDGDEDFQGEIIPAPLNKPSFFCPERGKVSGLITAELSMIALSILAWEPLSISADIRSQVCSVRKV